MDYNKHIVLSGSTIQSVLIILNNLAQDAVVFVVDENNKLVGALTDGDVRRGILKGFKPEDSIDNIYKRNPKFINKDLFDIQKIIDFRDNGYTIVPIVDEKMQIINVINFRKIKSYLPIDVVIMAGGIGKRLRPLTNKKPKPLLKIGEKTIIEHNLHRLTKFGIENFWISINYLGEQIEKQLVYNSKIKFIKEKKPLGTIGSVSKVKDFKNEYVLVTNSDLLTNIDYENFFLEFLKKDADFAILTIPYEVTIPYGVIESLNGDVKSLKEKPKYTYYSNGGIYLMKREILNIIPKNKFYNTTDLIERLIKNKSKIISIPFTGYWLDIGKPEDFEKAQKEVSLINFK